LEKRYQVFVSSTYADLKDERHKVIQTLMELDCIPAGMELFPAADEDQFEFIKRVIDDCDYYLLVIGGRYGSITAQGISYTEQEYDYALERGLKVIVLLHANPNQIVFEKSEQDPELRASLQAFRDKAATGRLVKFWQNAEELPGIVALSLSKTIKMFPAIGWVRADKVSSEELLIEINELRKQNAELIKSLSEIEPNIFTGNEEKDFSYIYNKINRFSEIHIIVKQQKNSDNNITKLTKKYYINLASLIPFISKSNITKYSWISISLMILHEIFKNQKDNINDYFVEEIKGITDELKMFGFLTINYVPPVPTNNGGFGHALIRGDSYQLIFSEKLERYKYWLNVTGKMPEHIEINEKDSQ
jgi:hypothetical protein